MGVAAVTAAFSYSTEYQAAATCWQTAFGLAGPGIRARVGLIRSYRGNLIARKWRARELSPGFRARDSKWRDRVQVHKGTSVGIIGPSRVSADEFVQKLHPFREGRCFFVRQRLDCCLMHPKHSEGGAPQIRRLCCIPPQLTRNGLRMASTDVRGRQGAVFVRKFAFGKLARPA